MLNVTGLAIGITCSALIFLWVEHELTFNHNFEKKDYLYQIMENQLNDGTLLTSGSTPGPLAQAIKNEIPGIKNAARLSWSMDQLIVTNNKLIKQNGVYADPSLFSMLTMQFLYGNPQNAFSQPQSIVISQSMAKRLFGNNNPVGATIEMNGKLGYSVDGLFTVTGVYRDFPGKSSYHFQWISPYEIFENKNTWIKPWSNNLTTTLAELDPTANTTAINQQLSTFLSIKAGTSNRQCFLFSMNDWNLRNHFTNGQQDGGKIRYVQLFSLIASIILFIACINFMNLSTARSQKRAREVGVRKVTGAARSNLVKQFISEALVLSFGAVLLSVIFIYLSLPAFNELVQQSLAINIFEPLHLGYLLAIGFITGLLSGSYPAFYLSGFNPVKVLKGIKLSNSPAVILIRKGLVVTQFSVSIVFIICTIIIYQQVHYIKARDLGYNKNNLIYMDLQGGLKQHFNIVREKLQATGFIENAALGLHNPLHIYSSTDRFKWQGKDPGNNVSIHSNVVSPEYVSTLRMQLTEGRDFYSTPGADSNHIIINESMARLMGKEGKLGATITVDNYPLQVTGIIKNYVYNDMYASGEPFILLCNPAPATGMLIRFKDGIDISKALSATETTLNTINPGYPFEYTFIDDAFNQLFTTETLIEKLAGVFAVLAIFISCLGLFGLAAFTAEQRIKEIGIRKVLGAPVYNLAGLLSKDFLKLVIWACAVAFPLALWAMHNWLQEYAYRTAIHWWVFALAGGSALGIALLTVSSQAIRTALTNPVKSLKTE
ncbi:MAG: ABC transporter permease [Chitinophagaceae bacterium]